MDQEQLTLMWTGLIAALIILAAYGITFVIRYRRFRQANAACGGCLACGNEEVESTTDAIICHACGYAGRLDRGGSIGYSEAGTSVKDLGRSVAKHLLGACRS